MGGGRRGGGERGDVRGEVVHGHDTAGAGAGRQFGGLGKACHYVLEADVAEADVALRGGGVGGGWVADGHAEALAFGLSSVAWQGRGRGGL